MKIASPAIFYLLLVFASSVFSKSLGHFKGYMQIDKNPIVVTKENFLSASNAHHAKSDQKIIRVLAMVDSQFNPGIVAQYGWKYRSKITSTIIELEGPEATAPYLTSLDGLLYAKMPSKVFSCMDSARKWSHVDEVQGTVSSNLPKSYNGSGVLVGIMETEFDTHHPAFLDSTGSTRFVSIWDQSDTSGPTNKYNYGTIKNHAQIEADPAFALDSDDVHGTWVTGIAAGSVVGSNPYYGVATKASLIGVKYSGADNDLIDGIQWIFSVADSLKMPCVINMSIGTHFGPHDGTSLIDQAIDTMSGNGKIIVGAAGNDGDKRAHVSMILNKNQTKGTWITPLNSEKSDGTTSSVSAVEIWGDSGIYYSVTLSILDSSTMSYSELQPTISTSVNKYYLDTLYWTNTTTGTIDTLVFEAIAERKSALNNKVHVQAVVGGSNPNLFLGINITSTSSSTDTIHAWNLCKKSFESFSLSGYSGGDSSMSINEIGGTSQRNITVGAYISDLYVKMWDGTEIGQEEHHNELTPYSSYGPTVDGRVKPDITAPGCRIVCPHSSAGAIKDIVIWPDTNTTYGRYIANEGTSFAAPIVTGIVALMLEVNPTLSPEEVKTIIQETALTDATTGTITTPNNYWGAGRIDALKAMQTLLGITESRIAKSSKSDDVKIHFLSHAIKITGGLSSNFPHEAAWYSINGKLIKKQTIGLDQIIQYPEAASGQVYILKLQTLNAIKTMILKK